MMRLESDLAQVLLAACRGELGEVSLTWSPELALVVVKAILALQEGDCNKKY
jgi:phosphoribosylamine--glycine ligase